VDVPTTSPWALIALAAVVAFLSGSLPLSPWIVRLVAKRDVREIGDGNPGAANAFRTAGFVPGLLVLLLDVTKGVLPIVLARDALDVDGATLALVAVMPVAGAAFSPFLGWRGGKALAVTLGAWIGLTTWTIPLVAVAVIVVATLLVEPDAWAVAAALSAMLLGAVLWERELALAVPLQAGVILWRHRAGLSRPPRLRRRAPRAARPSRPRPT
jgi:acyl phosphate:glycerol-3-phosphate acyltransferase